METTPLSGNIETLLGYKGKDLALLTDDELRVNFKDVFDFEKSLRDNAGLIKAEMGQVKDPDSIENDIPVAKKVSSPTKTKNADKRLAMMKELVELNRQLGLNVAPKL